MSRIGNRVIAIPEGVTATVSEGIITIKGSKGELTEKLAKHITVEVLDNTIVVKRDNDSIPAKSMHGTTNANIQNMIEGVTKGFSKGLEIIGVGYRFTLKGDVLVVNAGYSHPVEITIPAGIKVEAKNNTEITVSGISKVLVGEFAANVRKVRKPEPYKGKGIRYVGEHVRRKEGKKAK